MVTWNAVHSTKQSLALLMQQTNHPSWRVIVVDNASTDGTIEWVRRLESVTLIANETNLGFPKACNQGIRASNPGEDIVLLNNDLFVGDPNWLCRLQDAAYSSPEVGVVGTRQVDDLGNIVQAGSYMPPLFLQGQQMNGGQIDVNQAIRVRDVEAVVFAQAYIRRDCIEAVGLLDEDFFAYFEDSDYCLRAVKAGKKVLCAGNVHSLHRQHTSTRENRIDFWGIYNDSRERFRKKWSTWLERERYEGNAVWHSVVHEPLGYAVQSRNLMRAVHFAGLRLTYRNAYGQTDGKTGDFLIDDMMQREADEAALQIGFCQADAFHAITGRYKVGWSMLEVTGLPSSWAQGCNKMQEVWVPASFNVESFRASGVRTPIHTMPLGVDIDYFNPQIRSFRPSDRFIFLSVFEWGERKAPEVLLKAFAEEFAPQDDVMLLLNVFNRDPSVNVLSEIASMGLPPGLPLVVMLNARLPDYQMGALYRSADCFVLPSRGEGWGMPVLEAMACGLPAIATKWGGPADFLDESVGYPLSYSMTDAKARCPYYEGFQWAEPDPEHLKASMREVYENPAKAQAKGAAAAAMVAANYTWEHAARRIKNRLAELGEISPQGPRSTGGLV